MPTLRDRLVHRWSDRWKADHDSLLWSRRLVGYLSTRRFLLRRRWLPTIPVIGLLTASGRPTTVLPPEEDRFVFHTRLWLTKVPGMEWPVGGVASLSWKCRSLKHHYLLHSPRGSLPTWCFASIRPDIRLTCWLKAPATLAPPGHLSLPWGSTVKDPNLDV